MKPTAQFGDRNRSGYRCLPFISKRPAGGVPLEMAGLPRQHCKVERKKIRYTSNFSGCKIARRKLSSKTPGPYEISQGLCAQVSAAQLSITRFEVFRRFPIPFCTKAPLKYCLASDFIFALPGITSAPSKATVDGGKWHPGLSMLRPPVWAPRKGRRTSGFYIIAC